MKTETCKKNTFEENKMPRERDNVKCKGCRKSTDCPIRCKKIHSDWYASDSPDIYDEVRLNRRENDEQFTRMLEAERQHMLQRAMSMTRNGVDAEDLVQETFLRAYKARDTFDLDTNFRAWLNRIQLNIVLNHQKKARQNPAYGFSPIDDEDTLDAIGIENDTWKMNPEKIFFSYHISDHVREALDKTPEKQRTAFMLHFDQQYEYHEIAEKLDIPVGSVKSRIFRIRENLRESLAAQEAC